MKIKNIIIIATVFLFVNCSDSSENKEKKVIAKKSTEKVIKKVIKQKKLKVKKVIKQKKPKVKKVIAKKVIKKEIETSKPIIVKKPKYKTREELAFEELDMEVSKKENKSYKKKSKIYKRTKADDAFDELDSYF